jgi:hypothetical protein
MAKRCAFAALMAALDSTREAAATELVATGTTAAGWASVKGMQSSAEVKYHATRDIVPSHLDRKMTVRPHSPAAIRRPDKSLKRHQCKYDCIGDSASFWPRFVINAESASNRELERVRIHNLRFRISRQSIREAKRAQERIRSQGTATAAAEPGSRRIGRVATRADYLDRTGSVPGDRRTT